MKIFIAILLFLHAAIHFLGFSKAFSIFRLDQLKMPLSKTAGVLWLLAGALIVVFTLLYLFESRYSWLPGILALLLSQALIISYWKEARFGTIPNIILLLITLVSLGAYLFQRRVDKDTALLISRTGSVVSQPVTGKDLQGLPASVANWLTKSGMVGRDRILIGKVHQEAGMKMKPEQEGWLRAKAVQYTSIDNPAFVWAVDVKMNSFLGFKGRDLFTDGRGAMLIKLNALLNVVNETGGHLNEAALQRYLGEMVWFPSLALSSHISWRALSDTSAEATMTYMGTSGKGTFYFNDAGDFVKFSTLRFKDNTPDAKRYEWILVVDDYRVFDGIKVPSKVSATWRLEKGDWTWLNLEVTDLRYNEKAL